MNNNKVSAFSVFKAKEKIGFDIGLDSPSSKALNTPSKNGDMKSSNVKKKLKRNKNEPLSSLRNSIRKKVKKDAHHEISLKPAENKRKPSVLQVFERNWAENITDLNSSSLEREFLPQVLEQKKVQNDLHKIGYQEKSNSVVDLTAKKSEKKKSVRLKNQSSKASSAAINQEKNDITNEHSKNQIKNLSSLSGKELFNWVLAPISSERFFSEAWQKKPLFIKRRQPLYNTNWFSTKKLDKILREKNVQYTKNLDIAVYRNGQRETLNPEGRAFPSVVWKFYEDGCSIRLLNPQIFAKSVHQLTSRLQEYFGCLVGSNVYLTPPGSQGFAPHYDDIEAFVIQLEGKKHWKLYPPRNSNEVLARYSSENMQEDDKVPLIGHSTLKEFTQDILQKTVQLTQFGNSLATNLENYEYFSSFPIYSEFCLEEGSRLVNIIGELLKHHGVQCSWSSQKIDIEERFERLIDANDVMLETIGSLLDEAAGLKKNNKPILPPTSIYKQSSPVVSSWNKDKNYKSGAKSGAFKLLLAKNIQRPQLKFINKVDNSNKPFVPYIKQKHNAIKHDNLNDFGIEIEDFESHPYAYELSKLEPHDWQLVEAEPLKYPMLDTTNLTYIDTDEGLNDLINNLKKVKEIAVDLEHHSYRSFQGFLCLMQISTRFEDFIIDTLALREEMYKINEIFSDPNILKVMHGADSDIGWLQRDFGVYVVNMFDTGQAARTLHEDRFSLAYLLSKYCNVDAQKQYQLADWRIRPIPKEMVLYAQEDTHYLLYVYDVLRNQLLNKGNANKNLLKSVYSKSTSICATMYQKPLFNNDSYIATYEKYRGRLNPQQLECFRLLFEWRDKTAREEDESIVYTLPNHMLFQIAENLPKEPQGVIACCNPVPPLVKQRNTEIHLLVMLAREFDPQKYHQSSNNTNDLQNIQNTYKINLSDVSLKCGFEIYKVTGPSVESKQPTINLFEDKVFEGYSNQGKATAILSTLISPFLVYLPNIGKEIVAPAEINKAWEEACKKVEAIPDIVEPLPDVVEPKKKKKRPVNHDAEEKTLRELLPKKQKQDISKVDQKVKVSYDETVKEKADYVPFDYSAVDMKRFINKSSSSIPLDAYQSQDVKIGKVIKTGVRSKAKSMTFKH
ncbi:exosome complex component 10 isoform X2 [Hydra vulgaris]|uniref:Exosome complex component 10 isoform X2 n=1 Tax=Hydra vulgaris TaxID=6087 RepID=A0ABM4CIG1_HYDVU